MPCVGRQMQRVMLASAMGLASACDRPDAVVTGPDAVARGDAETVRDGGDPARPDARVDGGRAPRPDGHLPADGAPADGEARSDALPTRDLDPPQVDARAPADGAVAPADGAVAMADGRAGADAQPDGTAAPDGQALADAAVPDAGPVPWRMPLRARCEPGYEDPVDRAVMADVALVEASGLVPSPTQPEVLWLHNDSGDAARLFAARTDGTQLGRVFLRDVVARDWEDLAAAPCPDGTGPCLYIGDIGNNRHNRRDLAVYVVPEPAVDPARPFGEVFAASFARYPFRYPQGGNPDAEALVVAPDGSTFYVFEKIDWDQARIWRHPGPLVPDVEVELVELHPFPSQGSLSPGGRQITGADLHPSGTRLVIRVYSGVYEYRFDRAGGLDRLDLAEVIEVLRGPESEPQGEAVAYDHEGTGLYTISEDAGGRGGRVLHHYPCRPGP